MIRESEIRELIDSLPPSVLRRLGQSRVAVTGAAGFLGSWLMPVLRATAQSVVGFDLRGNGRDVIECDVSKELPLTGVDLVINAASIASPKHYRRLPFETIAVNIDGTRNALELTRRNCARMLQMSTSEIYGDPPAEHIPTPESYWGHVSCRGSRACYDESKRCAETLCELYSERHGLEVVTVRIFNFCGAGLSLEDYRVVSAWANALLHDQPLRVFGDGSQTRTMCSVSDGIRGCLIALCDGAPGEVYNVGNERPEISMLELAHLCCEVAGRGAVELVDPPAVYVAEPQRRCPDLTRIRALGYEPQHDLPETLHRFFRSVGVIGDLAA